MGTATRDRLVEVSTALFQRQGLAATGIKQILSEARAPFSSLYHFFPEGKAQLAHEVIIGAGTAYQAQLEAVWDAEDDLFEAIDAIFLGAGALLEASGYADACPIATVALEVASADEKLRADCAEVFTAWIASATIRLQQSGIAEQAARSLALQMIMALEGAFLLSRTLRSVEPMVAAGAGVKSALASAQGDQHASAGAGRRR